MTRRNTAEEHDPASIRRVASRVRRLCQGLDEIADTMTESGIETMTVQFQQAVTRALRDLNVWTAAAEEALTKALHDAGAFRATNGGNNRER